MRISGLLFLIVAIMYVNGELPPSCESPIYCRGELLHTIQMARIFEDGKHFVDLKMKHDENQILLNFQILQDKYNSTVPKPELQQFIDDNFEEGDELENYDIPGLEINPQFLEEISNETVKNFAKDLLKIWPQLARNVKAVVFNNSSQYSFIPVPNPFIIPGGRFREYYYWDSYWIIDGLLISEMSEMARGMIENFISLVERVGFVPNGGRIYYSKRSQPPLLAFMAHKYYYQTQNVTWLSKRIGSLAKELEYWDAQSVQLRNGKRSYTLYQYNAVSEGPRPESYREDYQTASFFSDAARQRQTYVELKSAAESGWDFSSRWFFDELGGNLANLSYIKTTRLVPVDLNAFLCGAFRNMADLYNALGDSRQSSKWNDRFLKLRDAIDIILWDKQDRIWHDYDVKLSQHRRYFYPSNLAPLWSNCFQKRKGNKLGELALNYLLREGVLKYMGGIPTSLEDTGEQWDFPNAWAPPKTLS